MLTFRSSILMFLVLAVFSSNTWSKELLVYSGRDEKFVKPLIEEFSRQTGIKVKLESGNSSVLLSRMSLEDKKTDVDLYISNDAGNLQRGSAFGLFRPLPDSITSSIPVEHRSIENDWIGLSGRLRVLVVNNDSLHAGKIKSVFDMAKPELKDRIGITYGSNESFIGGVTSYMGFAEKEKVKGWLTGIRDNAGGNVFTKHSKIVAAVAEGKKDVGLVNHYYAYRHLKKNPDANFKIVIPDQETGGKAGVAWNVSGIAVSKYTDMPVEAEKLVAFLSSPEGQKVFAEVNQEYPTRADVPAASHVTPYREFRIAKTSMEDLGEKREKTIAEIQRIGMVFDHH
ncbi:extracellular solute-binding protein [Kaarinaea lacus]